MRVSEKEDVLRNNLLNAEKGGFFNLDTNSPDQLGVLISEESVLIGKCPDWKGVLISE